MRHFHSIWKNRTTEEVGSKHKHLSDHSSHDVSLSLPTCGADQLTHLLNYIPSTLVCSHCCIGVFYFMTRMSNSSLPPAVRAAQAPQPKDMLSVSDSHSYWRLFCSLPLPISILVMMALLAD